MREMGWKGDRTSGGIPRRIVDVWLYVRWGISDVIRLRVRLWVNLWIEPNSTIFCLVHTIDTRIKYISFHDAEF